MKKCAITGSFNPVTSGHIFLLKQALSLFDEVHMVILDNPQKKYDIAPEERLKLLNDMVKGFDRVVTAYSSGYACDYCIENNIGIMLRGVRDANDLKYELELRQLNLDFKGIDTLILLTDDKHRYISSSYVRENGHE